MTTPPLWHILAVRAQELLGDRQWHDMEWTLAQLGQVVPEDRAIRKAELDRIYGQRRKKDPDRFVDRPPVPREQSIATGRRAIARDFLRRPEAFETDRPGRPGEGNRELNAGRQVRLIGDLQRSLVWKTELDEEPVREERGPVTGDRLDLSRAMSTTAVELLGDGQWHSYEKTLRAIMRLIPPGVAIRQHAKTRETARRQRAARGAPPKEHLRIDSPPEKRIASGARTLAATYLNNSRVFEIEGRGKQGPRGLNAGHFDQRRIRMIAKPRTSKLDPIEVQLENALAELAVERQRVAALRKWMVNSGYSRFADELAPMPEDEDDD